MAANRKLPPSMAELRTSTHAALFVAWLNVVPDEFAAYQGGPQLQQRQQRADELHAAMVELRQQTEDET